MKTEVKKLWTDALRSGKYKQGKSVLRYDNEFCCLGVLCDLAVKAGVVNETQESGYKTYFYDYHTSYLPTEVVTWAGLDEKDPRANGKTLSSLNDQGLSFDAIANLIETGL